MDYVAPEFELDAFNCPHCHAYAQMVWNTLIMVKQARHNTTPYDIAICTKCGENSVWLKMVTAHQPAIITTGEMIQPDIVTSPSATLDMPDNVKADYNEAASVLNKSPRAAAALLRLGLQKLCVHLGQPGKNINKDIRALSAEGALSASIIKVLDTVRLTGNDAVHPGEMLDEDIDHVANRMFGLLNFIVNKAITEPKELEALYQMTPKTKRQFAEEADAKAKSIES